MAGQRFASFENLREREYNQLAHLRAGQQQAIADIQIMQSLQQTSQWIDKARTSLCSLVLHLTTSTPCTQMAAHLLGKEPGMLQARLHFVGMLALGAHRSMRLYAIHLPPAVSKITAVAQVLAPRASVLVAWLLVEDELPEE